RQSLTRTDTRQITVRTRDRHRTDRHSTGVGQNRRKNYVWQTRYSTNRTKWDRTETEPEQRQNQKWYKADNRNGTEQTREMEQNRRQKWEKTEMGQNKQQKWDRTDNRSLTKQTTEMGQNRQQKSDKTDNRNGTEQTT
ncbi:hypothetical protein BaRGS_00027840, partial [Batillaria attramentaria]